jgi:hypothetical protein
MGFTTVPDRAAGYPLQESDWDQLKDNFNTAAWQLIASVELSADAAQIDFTSIPGTFSNLLFRGYMTQAGAGGAELGVRFNGDTASNYYAGYIRHQGAGAPTVTRNGPNGKSRGGLFQSIVDSSNHFGVFEMVIPGYASTAFHKMTLSTHSNLCASGTANLRMVFAGWAQWVSTAAITQVSFMDGSASANWKAGSRIGMYGLL